MANLILKCVMLYHIRYTSIQTRRASIWGVSIGLKIKRGRGRRRMEGNI